MPCFIFSLSIPNVFPTKAEHKLFKIKCSPATGTCIFTSSWFKIQVKLLLSSFNFTFLACNVLEFSIPYVIIFFFVLFSSYHWCNKSLSLFIIIVGFLAPFNISNFAFKIFSLEPKFPICDVPTFVIIHILGFAILLNNSISPKWFIPISKTIASSSFSFKIVNGIPILLLLFPIVFNVLYFWETTLATISLVLVFPTLPVIAITGISYRLLLNCAIW